MCLFWYCFLVIYDNNDLKIGDKEIWFVIIGKIGLGKSVMGNIFFGKVLFKLMFLGIFIICNCV